MSDEDCLKGMSNSQIQFLAKLDYLTTEELKLILLCELEPVLVLTENDFETYLSLDHHNR
jgi:hypothetical protein